MKIAIIVRNLTDGGAERVAAMWAEGFHKRGHEVSVVIFDDKSPITYNVPPGVTIRYVVTTSKNKILRAIQKASKLHKALKEISPDVIVDVIPTYWKRIAMLGTRGKKISTEHNSFERPDNAVAKYSKLQKIYLNRLYDQVTVLTQADKDVIGKQLNNVTVLPNPLALKPAKEIPPKKKMILAIGRIHAWHVKGFDILIKAWSEVASKVDGWKIQIVGDPKLGGLKYLQSLCEEYGVTGSVEFVGYQSDILPFYQEASIFVLSSRYEGFGLVLIEAMSQGCACVACDYKGRQKEIMLSEENGLICAPENVEALAKSMLSLIQDDEKRKEIGSNAIIRSHDFSIDNIMCKWDYFLERK